MSNKILINLVDAGIRGLPTTFDEIIIITDRSLEYNKICEINREDRKDFKDFIEKHFEGPEMKDFTYFILGNYTNEIKELSNYFINLDKLKKEEVTMCIGIEYIVLDDSDNEIVHGFRQLDLDCIKELNKVLETIIDIKIYPYPEYLRVIDKEYIDISSIPVVKHRKKNK